MSIKTAKMTSGLEESWISLSPDWGQNNTRQRPYDPQRLGIPCRPGRKGGHLASGLAVRWGYQKEWGINLLYTLNLPNVVRQLYLTRAGGKGHRSHPEAKDGTMWAQ